MVKDASAKDVPSGFTTMADAMEEISHYYAWMFSLIRPFLGRRVLEVGPGYGNIAKLILNEGIAYHAIDKDKGVVAALKRNYPSRAEAFFVGEIERSSHLSELRSLGTDTVLEVNVLEHVERDVDHLRALAGYVPGGRLVLFVPAMKILYGSWDEDAGHFRRYNKEDLRKAATEAGLQIERLAYFNGLGAILWFVTCRLLRLRLKSENTNRSVVIYDRVILPIARFLDPLLSPFFGQSLLAVLKSESP